MALLVNNVAPFTAAVESERISTVFGDGRVETVGAICICIAELIFAAVAAIVTASLRPRKIQYSEMCQEIIEQGLGVPNITAVVKVGVESAHQAHIGSCPRKPSPLAVVATTPVGIRNLQM